MTEILDQWSDFTRQNAKMKSMFIYGKVNSSELFFKDTFNLLVDSILYKKLCTLTPQNGTKTKPNTHKHVSNVT